MKHLPILKPGSIDYQFTEDVNRRQRWRRFVRDAITIGWPFIVPIAIAIGFLLGYVVGISHHH